MSYNVCLSCGGILTAHKADCILDPYSSNFSTNYAKGVIAELSRVVNIWEMVSEKYEIEKGRERLRELEEEMNILQADLAQKSLKFKQRTGEYP